MTTFVLSSSSENPLRRFIILFYFVFYIFLLEGAECLSNPKFVKTSQHLMRTGRSLPEKLLVGYVTNHLHDLNDVSKVTQAIKDGVNVLIWSFIKFEVVDTETSSSGMEKDKTILKIKASQDIENYKKYKDTLNSMGYNSVLHLVAFGGWNGPHLPPGYSAEELYKVFRTFNAQGNIENSQVSSLLWDGIDWDLEGHDNIKHPNNEFSVGLLNQVGEFSQLAKNDGLVVSMAPPESYLDITTNRFSRFVNLTYPDDPWHQDFEYHGWNVYAFILAKYGHCIDFVFLQFYESWSHALYQTEKIGISQSDYLIQYVQNLSRHGFGYQVNFEDDPSVELQNQFVGFPLSKLVFGFANGWGIDSPKSIFFHPEEIKIAYDQLKRENLAPRGCGYWVVDEEGKNNFSLTKALHDILSNASMNCDGEEIGCQE